MKFTYTVPDLSSLEDNRIKDLSVADDIMDELRLIYLCGVPVRIKINSKNKWIELNSREEIKLTINEDMANKLFKFFYNEAYLFGFFNEDKLTIYDIYANENYFSSRDLNIFKEEVGMNIVENIFEGDFSYRALLLYLSEKKDPENYYILPNMYLSEERKFESDKKKIVSNMLFGKKYTMPIYKAPETANVSYTDYSYFDKDDDKVFNSSTKQEREEIFKQTLENVEKHYTTLKDLQSYEKDWYNTWHKKICYLYSIHTLPNTRKVFYDFLNENKTFYKVTNVKELSACILDMLDEKYPNKLNKLICTTDYDYFYKFFEEEMNVFYELFKLEHNKESK